MRSISFHLIALAAALLSASCSQIIEDVKSEGAEAVIATIGQETRTSIGEEEDGARKVLWSEGDRIILSAGTSSNLKAIYKAADYGSATAAFIPEDASKTVDFSAGIIAGYPVEEMYIGKPDGNTELYFTIPSEQHYVSGSFDEGAMPMISDVAYEPVLNFHNAAGVLRLNLSSESSAISIASITITTSEYISGECGYIPNSKKIFFDDSMICSNQVSLICDGGVKISSSPVPFYIVVPHQTYSDMSICVTTTDGKQQTFRMKSGKEISIKRSTITTIPLLLNQIDDAQDPKFTIKIESVTFENIRVSIEIKNTQSYFCGLQTKESFLKDLDSGYLLESLPYTNPYTAPLSYTGNITSFQEALGDVLIEAGQSYVIWFVPYDKNGEYTKDDLKYVETMTKGFTSGGSVKVSYSDLVIDMTSISMTVSASGSSYIYCQLLPDEVLLNYPEEKDKINMLLTPGSGSTVFDKYQDILIRKQLRPGARMTLIAVAIDRNGKYGPLLTEHFETDHIPYNDLEVSIDKDLAAFRNTSTINWSSSGGDVVQYRYILKETGSHLWQNVFEQSVEMAQETMYLSPGLYYITSLEGTSAKISNLTEGTEYIMIVVAVDADGNISVADSWTFTY